MLAELEQRQLQWYQYKVLERSVCIAAPPALIKSLQCTLLIYMYMYSVIYVNYMVNYVRRESSKLCPFSELISISHFRVVSFLPVQCKVLCLSCKIWRSCVSDLTADWSKRSCVFSIFLIEVVSLLSPPTVLRSCVPTACTICRHKTNEMLQITDSRD